MSFRLGAVAVPNTSIDWRSAPWPSYWRVLTVVHGAYHHDNTITLLSSTRYRRHIGLLKVTITNIETSAPTISPDHFNSFYRVTKRESLINRIAYIYVQAYRIIRVYALQCKCSMPHIAEAVTNYKHKVPSKEFENHSIAYDWHDVHARKTTRLYKLH